MRIRMLNMDLPGAGENYVEQDGGLLVRNVKLLAPGTWTDAAQRTPLHYTPAVLRKYAENWKGTTYWARHSGGAPRNIVTDRLGDVIETRWSADEDNGPDAEKGAIMGSVFYDCITSASKDGAALALARVKAGKPLAVSVELYGAERYNAELKRNEADDLTFIGLASVDRGACESCKLPATYEEADQIEKGDQNMDEAELKQMLAAFKEELLAAVDEKLAAFKDSLEGGEGPAEPEDKEMSEAVSKLTKELGEAVKKIEALEKRPQPRTAPEQSRELDELDVPEGYTMRRQ